MVLSVQDHSLHPPKTWVKLWVKPMRQSSKSPVYQGFSALQVEEIRPQSGSSRSAVQQEIIDYTNTAKSPEIRYFPGFSYAQKSWKVLLTLMCAESQFVRLWNYITVRSTKERTYYKYVRWRRTSSVIPISPIWFTLRWIQRRYSTWRVMKTVRWRWIFTQRWNIISRRRSCRW